MKAQELIERIQAEANAHARSMSRSAWIEVCEELEDFFSVSAEAARNDEAKEVDG